jgi:uncharacterized protein
MGPRPLLMPVLSVHGRKPPAWLLSTSEPLAAEQRSALERVAAETGIRLRLPAAAEFKTFQSRNDMAPCGPAGTIVVLGRLDWSEATPGWIGQWHTCWQGHQHGWGIRGGGYDQAFANIVQGVLPLGSGRGTPDGVPAKGH